MNRLIKQAFTLIELLVVIAIIGILSGLIVVSMGGVISSANLARAQAFSNSLRNGLMGDISSEWKFDIDGADSWGSNSGSLVGATIVTSDCLRGPCLSFNGQVNNYFIKNPYSGFPANEFTFESWVKTSSAKDGSVVSYATSHSDNDFLIIGPSGLSIYFLSTQLSTAVKANDGYWHHIVVTWTNSNGAIKMYFDGTSRYTGTIGLGASFLDSGSLVIGQDQDTVGGGFDGLQSFLGSIDEVRLYKKSIAFFQVKEQYFAGLNSLLSSGQIDAKEYSKRINLIASNE